MSLINVKVILKHPCQGQENHLLDCQQKNISVAAGCSPAYVECDPGFPLTLRLHQSGVPAQLLNREDVQFGYPVIDTTENMGLICGGGTNKYAVDKICQLLGFKKVWTTE